MDENHIGPNINTIPVKHLSLVHLLGLAISMITGRMWETMEIFYFWFLLLFCVLILSLLSGSPENAGVR